MTKYTLTDSCGKCGSDLTEVPDSLLIPKSSKIREWKKIEKALQEGEIYLLTGHSDYNGELRHQRFHPEHKSLDQKLHRQENNKGARTDYLEIKESHPEVIAQILEVSESNEHIHTQDAESRLSVIKSSFPAISEEQFVKFVRVVSRYTLIERIKDNRPHKHPTPFANKKNKRA